MAHRQRKTIRWQHWDYGWDAAYFITICTKDRVHYFGEVVDGDMELSPLGVLADVFWYEARHHAKNMILDSFVVMPNHIHGILILKNNDDIATVGTRHALSRQSRRSSETIGQQRFQNPGKNTVSSIIGSYKSAVTKHAHRLGYDFAWQSRFHDHVIRDERAFRNIANYIANNPAKWQADRFRPS